MNLRYADHRDGKAAIEECEFSRYFVSAIAFPRIIIRIAGRDGRLVLADRREETRRLRRVHMPALVVNVHSLAGKHDGGGDVAQQWNKLLGIRGSKADRVHEKVGTAIEEMTERGGVMSVYRIEPRPFAC